MSKVSLLVASLIVFSASTVFACTGGNCGSGTGFKKAITLGCTGGGGLLLRKRLDATLRSRFESAGLAVSDIIIDLKDRNRPTYTVYEEIGGVQVQGLNTGNPRITLSTILNDSIESKNCRILRTLKVTVVLADGRTITSAPFYFKADGKFLLP